MNFKHMIFKHFFLGALLAAGVVACTEPVEQINEVQPHYLAKSTFEGDWYFRQTIVDASPLTSAGAFQGLEGSMEKIRWEISETYLTAYRTHEAVPGLDQSRTLPGGRYQGDPVLRIPITQHFDIRRAYNAGTGENSNRTVENSSDRPWYQRAYFRVDWTGNANLTNAEILNLRLGSFNTDYVRETDVFNPDHLQVTDDYIQITQRGIVESNLSNCVLNHGSWGCGAGEATLRYSFVKIDADEAARFRPAVYDDLIPLTDAEGKQLRTINLTVPFDPDTRQIVGDESDRVELACTPELIEFLDRVFYPGYITERDCGEASVVQMEKFGFFRTERYRYDRRVGAGHDFNREFYANIHDIWKNGRTQDETGEWVDTPDDELVPKPVVYYLNAGFPRDLEDVAAQMANDWDAGFAEAAAERMGISLTELRAVLAEEEAPAWAFLEADALKGTGMFQIRRNTCSPEGIDAYLARNKNLNDVVEMATDGAGILPGNMQRVCSGLTHFSRARGAEPFTWQQVGDLRFNFVNWVNEVQIAGPLGYGPSSADPETGRIQAGSAHVYGASVDTYARSAADIVRAMNEDLDLNALITGASYEEWLARPQSVADLQFELNPDRIAELNARLGGFDVEEAYGAYRLPNGRLDSAAFERGLQARVDHPLPGDPLAAALNRPVDEGRQRLDALRQDPVFRSRLMHPEHLQLVRRMYGLAPEEPLTEEMEEAALDLSVAPQAFEANHHPLRKVWEANNVYLSDFIDDSVIGKAMELKGLDPDEVFRQLRADIFRGVMLHEIGHTVGLRHNFEGSFDALNYHDPFWEIHQSTDDEHTRNERKLPEYRYSSIMDYGARFNSDFHGLGKYDRAAIKAAYGGVMEVFEEDVIPPSDLELEVFIDGVERIPELLGGAENIQRRLNLPLAEVVETRRAGVLENTRKVIEDATRPLTDYARDRQVPYAFCSDEFNGNLTCRTWDEGASHAEVIRSAIQNYWNYYAFNAYRRGRAESGFISGFFSRQNRLALYISYPFRYFYFYQQYDIGLRNDLYEAALLSLNFINQVIGTPLPGKHCLDADRNVYLPVEQFDPKLVADCEAVEVPLGTGREEVNAVTDEYNYRYEYIGAFYDKVNFINYLMDTATNFVRVANLGDRRSFAIGYYRVFRPEMLKLLRDMTFAWLEGEVNESSASLVLSEGPVAERIVPRILVDREAFGQPEAATADAPRLYSGVGYSLLWQSLVLSTIFNTSTYDAQLDFAEYLAVSEKGSGDDREYPADWEVAEFTHPRTGITYRAAQTSDGQSLSHEVLTRASQFVAQVWEPAADDQRADPFNADLQARLDAADRKLEAYTDLISDLRLLRGAVDHGED